MTVQPILCRTFLISDIDSGSPPAPHDTEVHGENEAMVRHASDVEVGDDGEDLTCSYTTWTNMPNTTRATIWLAHKYFRMKANGDFEYNFEDCATCPFDAAEEERDMYLSFNRVNLEESDHTGHGVCSVKLSWICNVEDTNV